MTPLQILMQAGPPLLTPSSSSLEVIDEMSGTHQFDTIQERRAQITGAMKVLEIKDPNTDSHKAREDSTDSTVPKYEIGTMLGIGSLGKSTVNPNKFSDDASKGLLFLISFLRGADSSYLSHTISS